MHFEDPEFETLPVAVKLEVGNEESSSSVQAVAMSSCSYYGSESQSDDDLDRGVHGRAVSNEGLATYGKQFFNSAMRGGITKLPSSLEIIKQGSPLSNSFSNSLESFIGNPHFMQALAAFGFIGAHSGVSGPGNGTPTGITSIKRMKGRSRKSIGLAARKTNCGVLPILDKGTTNASETNDQDNGELLRCSFCDYSTKLRGALTFHMMKHEASKPFTCPHCSYSTSRSSDLKKHFRIHTGEKPFKCEECDYRSTEHGALRKHMLTHSCDNPHCCPHCDYVSPRIGDLKRHLHVHSDQKPHACQHCDYRAAQLQHLRKHMLIHTGIKPYQCTYCDYRCREPRNLKTHIQTHTGDRPYGCPHCQYKAGRLGTLRRHISSIHPTNESPLPTASRHFLAAEDDQEQESQQTD